LPFLFILPITKLMLPIGSPIAPEVEINIKVLHGDALKGSNQETHCLIGNHKPEMAGFDASNVENPGKPPMIECRAMPTDSSMRQKDERQKTGEPEGDDEGWSTDEPRRRRISSSKSLPSLKSQCSYFAGGLSPCILAMKPESGQSRRAKVRRAQGGAPQQP
jgi:hypothetical protein